MYYGQAHIDTLRDGFTEALQSRMLYDLFWKTNRVYLRLIPVRSVISWKARYIDLTDFLNSLLAKFNSFAKMEAKQLCISFTLVLVISVQAGQMGMESRSKGVGQNPFYHFWVLESDKCHFYLFFCAENFLKQFKTCLMQKYIWWEYILVAYFKVTWILDICQLYYAIGNARH